MMKLQLNPFPVLKTERLILKQLELSDDFVIFALRSDINVNKFIDRKAAKTIKDAQIFIEKINENIAKNEAIYWAIRLKNSDELIGTICFYNINFNEFIVEIGYELLPKFQGHGYMQEAINAAINYAFSIGFKTITAFSKATNLLSIKLLEKMNFENIESLNEGDYIYFVLTKK